MTKQTYQKTLCFSNINYPHSRTLLTYFTYKSFDTKIQNMRHHTSLHHLYQMCWKQYLKHILPCHFSYPSFLLWQRIPNTSKHKLVIKANYPTSLVSIFNSVVTTEEIFVKKIQRWKHDNGRISRWELYSNNKYFVTSSCIGGSCS